MYCEKYRCIMDESVCIGRQEKACGAPGRGRPRWSGYDPGCINCEQGMAIQKKYKNRTVNSGINVLIDVLKTEINKKREKEAMNLKAEDVSGKGGSREKETAQTKICSRCGEEKELDTDHWYRKPKLKSGWSSRCKDCLQKLAKENYKKHKVKENKAEEPSAPEKFSAPGKNTETAEAKGPETEVMKPVKNSVLHLDFSNHKQLLTDIKTEAGIQLRTTEMQAMWMILTTYQKESTGLGMQFAERGRCG